MSCRHSAHALVQGRSSHGGRTRGTVRGTLLWGVLVAAAGALALSAFTVPEGQVCVVARFGDPRRVVEDAGLHFKWPSPIDSVYRIDTRTHVLDPDIAEFLTNDKKNVEVDGFVAWRVNDPKQFLTSLRSRETADDRIGQVLMSALVEVMGRGPFDDLVSLEPRERDLVAIRNELREETARQCAMNGYGVEITLVGIERITFPDDNKAYVEAAMRESRNKDASAIDSEGLMAANVIDTETRATVAEIETSAEEEAARIRAEGVAQAEAIKQAAYALNPDLYLFLENQEVVEQALGGSLVILPADSWMATLFDEPLAPTPPAQDGPQDDAKGPPAGGDDQ